MYGFRARCSASHPVARLAHSGCPFEFNCAWVGRVGATVMLALHALSPIPTVTRIASSVKFVRRLSNQRSHTACDSLAHLTADAFSGHSQGAGKRFSPAIRLSALQCRYVVWRKALRLRNLTACRSWPLNEPAYAGRPSILYAS